uniref:Uncharacterized protein n=1 Tax=Magallana gigas TaxID=29159 RepID=K1QAI3_MAGGI
MNAVRGRGGGRGFNRGLRGGVRGQRGGGGAPRGGSMARGGGDGMTSRETGVFQGEVVEDLDSQSNKEEGLAAVHAEEDSEAGAEGGEASETEGKS